MRKGCLFTKLDFAGYTDLKVIDTGSHWFCIHQCQSHSTEVFSPGFYHKFYTSLGSLMAPSLNSPKWLIQATSLVSVLRMDYPFRPGCSQPRWYLTIWQCHFVYSLIQLCKSAVFAVATQYQPECPATDVWPSCCEHGGPQRQLTYPHTIHHTSCHIYALWHIRAGPELVAEHDREVARFEKIVY